MSQHSEKSHKAVNIYDKKKHTTSVKKTQKCKFR